MYNVEVKIKLAPGAVMPTYATEGDSGVDLYPIQNGLITPNARGVLINTGIRVELPKGFEIQIRGKSGNNIRTPLRVALGTIDEGYRGTIGVIVDNLSDEIIEISKDKAIAQAVLQQVPKMRFVEVEQLDENTERGSGGFGSSGRGL